MSERTWGDEEKAISIELAALRETLGENMALTQQVASLTAQVDRHVTQAHAISHLLELAQVGPCTLAEGVRLLLNRSESLTAQVETLRREREAAERCVKSIAVMLGWENVPPQQTLEADIRALKARAALLPAEGRTQP